VWPEHYDWVETRALHQTSETSEEVDNVPTPATPDATAEKEKEGLASPEAGRSVAPSFAEDVVPKVKQDSPEEIRKTLRFATIVAIATFIIFIILCVRAHSLGGRALLRATLSLTRCSRTAQHPSADVRHRLHLDQGRVHLLRRRRVYLGFLYAPFPLFAALAAPRARPECRADPRLSRTGGAFVCVCLPLIEEREAIARICGHIWADLRGKGPKREAAVTQGQ